MFSLALWISDILSKKAWSKSLKFLLLGTNSCWKVLDVMSAYVCFQNQIGPPEQIFCWIETIMQCGLKTALRAMTSTPIACSAVTWSKMILRMNRGLCLGNWIPVLTVCVQDLKTAHQKLLKNASFPYGTVKWASFCVFISHYLKASWNQPVTTKTWLWICKQTWHEKDRFFTKIESFWTAKVTT